MKMVRKFGDMRRGARGLIAVWREEWHFKYQLLMALVAFFLAVCVGADPYQLVVLFATLCVAVASEIINTAIEDICNRITPDFDERIGAIKDMSQAFVIVSALPALFVLCWILYTQAL